MASSKVMASSNPKKSDLSRRSSSAAPLPVDAILRDVYDSDPTLLDAQISLIEAPATINAPVAASAAATTNPGGGGPSIPSKSVDDVWREIVSGDRRECKEEATDYELMTLEDFLVKAGAVDDDEVKMPIPLTGRLSSGGGGGGVFAFDPVPSASFQALENAEGSVIGFGNGVEVVEGGGGGRGGGGGGRGKRGRNVLEPLDKAAQQRQRRMIKNRESAARSRERKQAYQVELESLAVRLEEENEQMLKEKAEKSKERYKQLMEKVIPIVEKQRPPRLLRRVRSLQW